MTVDDDAPTRETAAHRLAFYRGAQAGVFSLAQLRECPDLPARPGADAAPSRAG